MHRTCAVITPGTKSCAKTSWRCPKCSTSSAASSSEQSSAKQPKQTSNQENLLELCVECAGPFEVGSDQDVLWCNSCLKKSHMTCANCASGGKELSKNFWLCSACSLESVPDLITKPIRSATPTKPKQSENDSAEFCSECSRPFNPGHKSVVSCTVCSQKSHFECAEYACPSIGQQMSRKSWCCSTCSLVQPSPNEISLRKSSTSTELPKVTSRLECQEQLSNADKVVYNGITISKSSTPVQTPKKTPSISTLSRTPTASPLRSQVSPTPKIISSTISKRFQKNSRNLNNPNSRPKVDLISRQIGLTISKETVNSQNVPKQLSQNAERQQNDVIDLGSDEDEVEILSDNCKSTSQPAAPMTSAALPVTSSTLPVTSSKKTPKVSPRRADLPSSLYHRRSRSNLSTLFESNSESDSQQTPSNATNNNSTTDISMNGHYATTNRISTNVVLENDDSNIAVEDDDEISEVAPKRIVKVLVDDSALQSLVQLGFEIVD